MLQALLKERLGFTSHWGTRTLKVYKIVMDTGGLKLKWVLAGEPGADDSEKSAGIRLRSLYIPKLNVYHFDDEATVRQMASHLRLC